MGIIFDNRRRQIPVTALETIGVADHLLTPPPRDVPNGIASEWSTKVTNLECEIATHQERLSKKTRHSKDEGKIE